MIIIKNNKNDKEKWEEKYSIKNNKIKALQLQLSEGLENNKDLNETNEMLKSGYEKLEINNQQYTAIIDGEKVFLKACVALNGNSASKCYASVTTIV